MALMCLEKHEMTTDELLAYDRQHIWHPYSSITNPLPMYAVESASGVRIRLSDGRELIDGMASWWSVIHGYNHPVLTVALKKQAEKLSHVMFGGLTHQPAVNLTKTLIKITPDPLDLVFFVDSGSVAVEVAMKMAIQYFYGAGKAEKKRFLTIRSGYHGDVFHCMSVCDPVTGMHQIFKGFLPEYHFADRPECGFHDEWDEKDIHSFKKLIEEHHASLCAVILEPIIQGAGGMRFYNPQYLRNVRKLCDRYNVLLIADEIATGFGRSGKLFACEHADIAPDLLCVGKALTGGYLSLAAVLTTRKIGETISGSDPGVFMHGPTFMANPLACAVANASVNLLIESSWKERVSQLEQGLRFGLAPCKDLKGVADVRVLGGIGVVEMIDPVNMKHIQPAFVDKGVWVRPFGRLVYVMPPYCMEKEDLAVLTNAICEVLEEAQGQ